jgi:hypothetical protein
MSGILRRKVAVRTFPPLPFQLPHLSPPPTRAEDFPAAKRPRPDTPLSTAENEAFDAATTASFISWVVVASSSSTTGVPLAHRRKWELAEADEEPTETRRRAGKKWSTEEDATLIAAVKKHGKKWVVVASMLPGRTNVRCRAHYNWVMRFDPSLSGPTAHAGKSTIEEDAELPNITEIAAVAAPTAATMTSTSSIDTEAASSIDTEAASRTYTASVTAPLICMEGSLVAPPEQLQQDEGIPVAKRPRFETPPSTFAEDEAADALTVLATMTATSSNHKVVTTARTYTSSVAAPLTCMGGSLVAPPEQLQQDESIPFAKKPRFKTSRPIAEVEVVDRSTEFKVGDLSSAETVTTTLRNHKEVAAAHSDAAMVVTPLMCMSGFRESARKRKPKESALRIEALHTSGNNGVAVTSMIPDQSKNARGAISWASVLEPTMIDRWSKVLDPTMIDRSTTQWTIAEDTRLLALVRILGMKWVKVAEGMPGLTYMQCRARWFDHFDHSIDRETGPWTAQEDAVLTSAVIKQNGHYCWVDVAEQIPTRSFHQCKQRWLQLKLTNYRVGKWTDEEGAMLTKAVKIHGKNWIAIAKEIPGRSNIQCQKRWTAAVVHNRDWATGDWTAVEDAMLTAGVKQHGRSWGMVAGEVPNRSHAQCRQRFEERRLRNVFQDLRKRSCAVSSKI